MSGLKLHSSSSRWGVIRPCTNVTEAKLFCLPYAGGGAATYRPWAKYFPPNIGISAAVLAGREARFNEVPATNVEEIVKPLADDILQDQSSTPIIFFGHSMGSILAYEIAKHLEAEGTKIAAMCVSGRLPPHIHYGGDMHKLGEKEFLQHLIQLGGIPDALLEQSSALKLFLPSIRHDYEISETYRTATIQLRSPIIVCDGKNDSETNKATMLQWQDLTSAPFFYRRFPGGHFYIRDQGPMIASYILQCVSQINFNRV